MDWGGVIGSDAWDARGGLMVAVPSSSVAPEADSHAPPRVPTALRDRELESFGPPDPRILVCGCGGSGNNTMNRITHIGVEGAITVAINTDKQHLDNTRAMQKLLVGRHITRGLGAGGDPVMGRRCAEAGRDVITKIVEGADLVFVTAGLEGALVQELHQWLPKKQSVLEHLLWLSLQLHSR